MKLMDKMKYKCAQNLLIHHSNHRDEKHEINHKVNCRGHCGVL